MEEKRYAVYFTNLELPNDGWNRYDDFETYAEAILEMVKILDDDEIMGEIGKYAYKIVKNREE